MVNFFVFLNFRTFGFVVVICDLVLVLEAIFHTFLNC